MTSSRDDRRPSLRRPLSFEEMWDPHALGEALELDSPPTIQGMGTVGYSGAEFARVRGERKGVPVGYVVKRTRVADDWFSCRTRDRDGREGAFLSQHSGDFGAVRDPVVAIARDSGRYALLMDDISPLLFPDERAPIAPEAEEAVLSALASFHAEHLGVSDEQRPGMKLRDFLYIMGPLGHGGSCRGGSARGVDAAIQTGWAAARPHLSESVRALLWSSPEELSARFDALPDTLVHGDVKLANMGYAPGRSLLLIDWAFVGTAPPAVDLGWYLAVNSPRMARSKSEVIALYRARFEEAAGHAADSIDWAEMEDLAVLTGALMLLWSKASALDSGREGAEDEWRWWVDRLEKIPR